MSGADRDALRQAVIRLAAVAALVLVPPAWVERLPSVCLNRHIFGFCPACGSLRALSYNPNCLLTGPVLVILLLSDLRRLARSSGGQTRSGSTA